MRHTNSQRRRHGALWPPPIRPSGAWPEGPAGALVCPPPASVPCLRGGPGRGWDRAEAPWLRHRESGGAGAAVSSGCAAAGAERNAVSVRDGGGGLRAAEAVSPLAGKGRGASGGPGVRRPRWPRSPAGLSPPAWPRRGPPAPQPRGPGAERSERLRPAFPGGSRRGLSDSAPPAQQAFPLVSGFLGPAAAMTRPSWGAAEI